ncbi:MAG: hypothetical protein JXA92_03080 [candidate division Zixibacteria bacterium]|nr:hypothetical protein [candidate division Zixibacteria bacterium]
MKKVLLVCYYFPPLGLGGVGRPLNLFKKLPAFDYDCHILTVKPVTYRLYEPELLEGLDKKKIFRSGSHDPQRLMYIFGVRKLNDRILKSSRRASDKFFPDSKAGWVKPAIRLGRTLVNNYRYAAVISTSPPVSSHLIAKQLAQDFDIPWVADFRDFWTSYKVEDSFTEKKNIEKGLKLLEEIKKDAAAVTVVNPTIAEYLDSEEIITNGFDSDTAQLWSTSKDTGSFYIGLLGNQNESKAVEPLFKVLTVLRKTAPVLFDRIKIIQVGQVDKEWFESVLDKFDLRNRCQIHGFQKRQDTVRLLSETSLFYIGLDASGEQKIMPSRMFDLLASGRPVLSFVAAESEIARLLGLTGAGIYFHDDTIDKAAEYLRQNIEKSASGNMHITPLPEYARPYSSEAMVEKFARLLDSLT